MKKTLLVLMAMAIISANTAFADILPEGEKAVSVCSFFNNSEDFLDEFGVFTQEIQMSGNASPYDRIINNECFSKNYKFNQYFVYGVSIAFLGDVEEEMDFRDNENAYPTNIGVHGGIVYEEETSPVSKYEYEYKILGLDSEKKLLNIELVGVHTLYTDDRSPTFEAAKKTEVLEDIFTDVDSTSTYYNALKYLKEEGIVNGYTDGSFKPYEKINRAEFTKIIVEANSTDLEIEGCLAYYANQTNAPANIFTDVIAYFGENIVSEWFVDYICVAKQKHYVNGYPDGSFKPAQYINFVESAKIITMTRGIPMEEGNPWYKIYVDQLDTRNAIPSTISTFSQFITRGEMAEIIYRINNDIIDLPSNSYESLK